MAKSRNSSELPLETFSKVVEAVYDCALDPNRWHDTVRLIAELCRSQRCALPRYADADVRLVTLLSPHICRAITISDALNLKTIRSEVLEATLNALTSGVYLVDRLGRLIYMNRAAELQVEKGNMLRIENNRLAPIDRMTRAVLGKAIDEAIADEAATPDASF